MAKRKEADFPLCQYAADGALIAMSPFEAYYFYQGLREETRDTELRLRTYNGAESVRDVVRGPTYDAPRLETAQFVLELLDRHDAKVDDWLSPELRNYLFGPLNS